MPRHRTLTVLACGFLVHVLRHGQLFFAAHAMALHALLRAENAGYDYRHGPPTPWHCSYAQQFPENAAW